MKNRFNIFFFVIFIITLKVYSQSGIGTQSIENGVMLQLNSSDSGFLLPRYALTSKSSTNPLPNDIPFGTMVFNTNTTGTFPNRITPGIYWWDSNDKLWNNISESLDNAAMKYLNNETTVNYNSTSWQNVRLFGTKNFNDSSNIYNVNSTASTVTIGRDGLYSISVLLSFDRLSANDNQGRLSLSSRVFVNNAAVGTEQVFSPGFTSSINARRGLFSHSYTEFLLLKRGDVVSIKIKRTEGSYGGTNANPYGASPVSFESAGDSSISIIRIR
nr:hypothetical protein [uncultured Flavobacterium sp.]